MKWHYWNDVAYHIGCHEGVLLWLSWLKCLLCILIKDGVFFLKKTLFYRIFINNHNYIILHLNNSKGLIF